MKLYVVGVTRMKGVGKTSGNPYDIAKLLALQAVRPVQNEKMVISGYGYEVSEVAMSPDAMASFAGVKLPAELDLETDMENRGGKLVPVVVGVRKAA